MWLVRAQRQLVRKLWYVRPTIRSPLKGRQAAVWVTLEQLWLGAYRRRNIGLPCICFESLILGF